MLSAGLTDQGKVRGNNEDRFHIDDQRGIYMVVDGMGGQAAGEEAADIAVKTMRARLERATETADLRIREAIALANNAIFEAANNKPEWRGMACVLTVAVVEDGTATIGHVGDSRLYLLRAGKIEKLTKDHSPVGEREDSGELTEDAAMKHPRRNEVYRDVGSVVRTPDDPDFIDVRKIKFPSDGALLLCSDGLSDVLPSKRILRIVEENAGDCAAAVKILVREAVADGKDNVSVVLLQGDAFAKAEPARPSAPHPEPTPKPRRFPLGWVIVGLLAGIGAASAYFISQAPAAGPAPPKTIHVAQQGGDFASIPEAIIHANPGDTIELAPGTYTDRLILRSSLRLVGSRTGESILTGGITADGLHNVTIEGFVMQGGLGIVVRNSVVTIERMRVANVKGAGVEFQGDSTGVLRASRIVGNEGAGVVVLDTASPTIENTFISGNGKDEDEPKPGIEFLSTGAPHLISNGIADNGAEPLWLLSPPDPAMLAQNVLQPVAKKVFRIVKPGDKP